MSESNGISEMPVETQTPPPGTDVVIVGGGAIGSAIACFLTQDDRDLAVTVIERDPSYAKASSALSASSIRQQFSSAINIRMSQYGIAFLREIGTRLAVDGDRPEIGLVEPGYLYLATQGGVPVLRENHAVQQALGVQVELMRPERLKAKFPWVSTEDVALASHGLADEGWFDGYSLLQAFRKKAISQGVRYVKADATGFALDGGRITAVRLASGAALHADVFVNAGGPWAASVAKWAGIELPVRARRRSVFSFSCPDRLPGCPLVIDPSGIWFRPEGEQFICGYAPPEAEDADGLPLEVAYHAFDDFIWPTLAGRVPAFEAMRMTGAWAGYYEMNTFDHNAILGLHPACGNLYFAAGFSGHGLQQCPAVGRGIAELIRFGEYRSLDLSEVGFARLLENKPLLERNVI
nr:FAD-dependent oxidoreductase [Ralstonia solanacearum P673]